jgi:hypothetical protein
LAKSEEIEESENNRTHSDASTMKAQDGIIDILAETRRSISGDVGTLRHFAPTGTTERPLLIGRVNDQHSRDYLASVHAAPTDQRLTLGTDRGRECGDAQGVLDQLDFHQWNIHRRPPQNDAVQVAILFIAGFLTSDTL